MSEMYIKILLTGIPVLLLWSGGLLGLLKTAGAPFKSIVLHFAGGVVFSVVAVEILPDMVRLHNPFTLVAGFMCGFLAMLSVKLITKQSDTAVTNEESKPGISWSGLTAFGIDLFIDGVLLGIGFAAGQKEGIMLAAALALECFALGMAVVTTIRYSVSRTAIIYRILCGLALVFVLGAASGLLLLHQASDRLMEFILSFGAAALLYLVTEELLVEAHEEKDSPLFTGCFFMGFLIFLVLGIIL